MRILVLGGGFGGVTTVRHLERVLRRRLRIVLDWTVALFFRPDTTWVDLRVEREQVKQARSNVS